MENTSATTLTDLALLDERAALDHDVDGAGLARAGAPVVGRSAHLPRVVRGLAQRGVRHLLRVRLARARQGARRGRLRAAGRHRRLPGRGGALPATGRLPAVRRADPPLRRAPLRKGGARPAHAAARARRRAVLARDRPLRRASTPAARSRRAIWRARSRRSPAAASSEILDRWIARPGHPELEGRWSWDDDRKVGTLALAQKQAVTPRRRCSNSRRRCASRSTAGARRAGERREAAHSFEFPLPARPTQVIFDPGDVVLKTMKMEKSRALWRRQLAAARPGRRPASSRRARSPSSPSRPTSRRSSRRWATIASGRCAARRRARSARTRRDEARDALLAAIGDATTARAARHRRRAGRVRAATRRAGARARRRGCATAIRSVFVEAEAALALGRTRSPLALELLPTLRRSPVVPGRDRQPRHRGAGPDRRRARHSRSFARAWRRGGAVPGAARGGGRAGRARRAGPASRARRARRSRSGCATATSACAARRRWRWGASASSTRCRRFAAALAGELDGRTKRRMNEAIRDIEDGARPAEEARRLHEEVERLRGETARLRERMDRLETRLGPPPAQRPPPAKTKRPRPVARRRSRGRPPRRR